MHATASAAVDAGGFDRREMLLTRDTFELDERVTVRAAMVEHAPAVSDD
ncbi:MAG: hypothetical protein M3320_04050 [Actinomycetota bacterium]|nr:hypothetical protein [Actinomycetota bacterium]